MFERQVHPRPEIITIRLTAPERDYLESLARYYGIALGDVVRDAIYWRIQQLTEASPASASSLPSVPPTSPSSLLLDKLQYNNTIEKKEDKNRPRVRKQREKREDRLQSLQRKQASPLDGVPRYSEQPKPSTPGVIGMPTQWPQTPTFSLDREVDFTEIARKYVAAREAPRPKPTPQAEIESLDDEDDDSWEG